VGSELEKNLMQASLGFIAVGWKFIVIPTRNWIDFGLSTLFWGPRAVTSLQFQLKNHSMSQISYTIK
jgi:hypothetical protein